MRLAVLPLFAAQSLLAACGGGGAAESRGAPKSPTFETIDGKSGVFVSKRFGIRLPFPDGGAWRIDDHSHPDLRATHPDLGTLSLETTLTSEPMSSGKCDAYFAERGDPAVKRIGDLTHPPVVLENEQVLHPRGFETRVRVFVEVGGPGAPFKGHLLAIGGAARKCLLFHFSSEAADERVLGTRLGRVRTEIFDRLDIPEFGTIKREPIR